MKISVLMAACNQGTFLAETVESAHKGLRGCRDYEIIVIDDASTDGCCDAIRGDRRVRVIRPPQRIGVSAAKHLAGTQAKGDVIITTDTHCFYPEKSLWRLAACWAYPMRAIIVPSVILEGKRMIQGGGFELSKRGIRINFPTIARKWPALFGSIYVMNRWVWNTIGGWPILPGYWGCEEQMVSIMAYRLGVPIKVVEHHICTHRKYREHNQYPFELPDEDRARAAHWFHAVCFPQSYEKVWKPLIVNTYGDHPALVRDLMGRRFRVVSEWLERHAVWNEHRFFRTVMGIEDIFQLHEAVPDED